ncbi:MAG: HWE histidine kinase domain-containing protein [Novosphingobium sp.]
MDFRARTRCRRRDGRSMFGIFLDVTGRKQAEEGNELLAGKRSHRVKNPLAIASSLTILTSRSAQSIEEMTGTLTSRLMALGGPRYCKTHPGIAMQCNIACRFNFCPACPLRRSRRVQRSHPRPCRLRTTCRSPGLPRR